MRALGLGLGLTFQSTLGDVVAQVINVLTAPTYTAPAEGARLDSTYQAGDYDASPDGVNPVSETLIEYWLDGATATASTINTAGGTVRVRVTASDSATPANERVVFDQTINLPVVASGSLADLTLTEGVAQANDSVAGAFSANADTFALAPSSAALPAGVQLLANGDRVFDETLFVATASRTIVVRGSNSVTGEFADSAFQIVVEAASGTDTLVTAETVPFQINGTVYPSGISDDGVAWIAVGTDTPTMQDPAIYAQSVASYQSSAGTQAGPFQVGMSEVNPQRVPSGNGLALEQATNLSGYDERTNHDGALTATWPRQVQAGDIIVVQVPVTDTAAGIRDGMSERYGVCHILNQVPSAANTWVSGGAVGWPSRTTVTHYDVDFVALDTALPVLPDAFYLPPAAEIAHIMARTLINNPVATQNTLPAGNAGGYEALWPSQWGTRFDSDESNYSANLTYHQDTMLAYALSLPRGSADRMAVWRYLVRQGIDMVDALIGSAARIISNGGQQQHYLAPCSLALYATGRTSEIANLPITLEANQLGQTFEVTQAIFDNDLVPHNDVAKPYTYRLRTLAAGAVVGNDITIPVGAGDLSQMSFRNMVLTRQSDGAQARVLSQAIPGGASDTNTASATLDIVVTIDAQPGTPFADGDVIYFEPVGAIAVGDPAWSIGPYEREANTYNPSAQSVYRQVNNWTGQAVLLSPGIFPADLSAITEIDTFVRYIRKVNTPNTPLGDDFAAHGDNPYVMSLFTLFEDALFDGAAFELPPNGPYWSKSTTGPTFDMNQDGGANLTGNTGQLAYSTWASIPAGTSNSLNMFSISGANLALEVDTRPDKRSIKLEDIRDSSGAVVLSGVSSSDYLFPIGAMAKIEFALDIGDGVTDGTAKVWINGQIAIDAVVPAGSTGLFNEGSRFLCHSDGVAYDVGETKVYLEVGADGSMPTTAPLTTIPATAVGANAHPWKQGDNATAGGVSQPGEMAAPTLDTAASDSLVIARGADPASDGGAAITAYHAYWREGASGAFTRVANIGATFTLSGLTSETGYEVFTVAENSEGEGLPSRVVVFETVAAATNLLAAGEMDDPSLWPVVTGLSFANGEMVINSQSNMTITPTIGNHADIVPSSNYTMTITFGTVTAGPIRLLWETRATNDPASAAIQSERVPGGVSTYTPVTGEVLVIPVTSAALAEFGAPELQVVTGAGVQINISQITIAPA